MAALTEKQQNCSNIICLYSFLWISNPTTLRTSNTKLLTILCTINPYQATLLGYLTLATVLDTLNTNH